MGQSLRLSTVIFRRGYQIAFRGAVLVNHVLADARPLGVIGAVVILGAVFRAIAGTEWVGGDGACQGDEDEKECGEGLHCGVGVDVGVEGG